MYLPPAGQNCLPGYSVLRGKSVFYEEYKPFRNYMRRFDLVPGLVNVWCYSLHVMEGQPLPADYAVGKIALPFKPLKEHFYPWDLDILARELVLNAGKRGDRSLRTWNHLAVAVNQSYGRDWLYTWNPLEATPLVSFDPAFPDRVLCPIPRYLTRRASVVVPLPRGRAHRWPVAPQAG